MLLCVSRDLEVIMGHYQELLLLPGSRDAQLYLQLMVVFVCH